MTYSLSVTKVCGFNGDEPYNGYNRKFSRAIHLIYVKTGDATEDTSWAYRSLCHLDEQNKLCL
jgi:hypothetical protein